MAESKIQTSIIQYLEKEGWDCIKTIRLSKAGYPDILAQKDGMSIWLECKASAKAKRAPLQIKRINDLKRNGFIAEFVWEVDQVRDIISSISCEGS